MSVGFEGLELLAGSSYNNVSHAMLHCDSSSNISTRNAEIESIWKWLKQNNLMLNCSLSNEIVWTDCKWKLW